MIRDLEPGDIVFHHYDAYLRAVSRVVTPSKHAERPPENPKDFPEEPDEGWLVEIEPIRTGVDLNNRQVAKLIENGPEKAINSGGTTTRGRFLSVLSEKDGLALLSELDLPAPSDAADSLFGRLDEWDGGDTDQVSLGSVLREQANLRRHLLYSRPIAPCAICREERPARLLVAAHIKPRSECSEEERKDFRSVAMLACSLGCDALFGWGYIYVDFDGKVRRGITAETSDVRDAVDLLVGKVCSAYNEDTAPNFKAHAESVLS